MQVDYLYHLLNSFIGRELLTVGLFLLRLESQVAVQLSSIQRLDLFSNVRVDPSS